MEIKYIGDGFEIWHNNSKLFSQKGPTNAATWTIAEKEAAATAMHGNYLESMVKTQHRARISRIYDQVLNQPYVDADGVRWYNGYESIQRLDGARRLAIEGGVPSMMLFDADGVGHDMPIADMTALVLAMGAELQATFTKKKALNASLKAAVNETEIAAIDVAGVFGIDPTNPFFM